jgi:hypothetical protein
MLSCAMPQDKGLERPVNLGPSRGSSPDYWRTDGPVIQVT